jgi:murein DD-endopeptidase MepM/ murein hydrolase activator NlpD
MSSALRFHDLTVRGVPKEATPAAAAVVFQLPFPVGQGWKANGPHAFRADGVGTRNSLDFGAPSGSGQVVAAAGGTVASVTNCGGGYEVRINHPDGWQTGYYNLSSVAAGIANGASVARGQAVGTTGTGCGRRLSTTSILAFVGMEPTST